MRSRRSICVSTGAPFLPLTSGGLAASPCRATNITTALSHHRYQRSVVRVAAAGGLYSMRTRADRPVQSICTSRGQRVPLSVAPDRACRQRQDSVQQSRMHVLELFCSLQFSSHATRHAYPHPCTLHTSLCCQSPEPPSHPELSAMSAYSPFGVRRGIGWGGAMRHASHAPWHAPCSHAPYAIRAMRAHATRVPSCKPCATPAMRHEAVRHASHAVDRRETASMRATPCEPRHASVQCSLAALQPSQAMKATSQPCEP